MNWQILAIASSIAFVATAQFRQESKQRHLERAIAGAFCFIVGAPFLFLEGWLVAVCVLCAFGWSVWKNLNLAGLATE